MFHASEIATVRTVMQLGWVLSLLASSTLLGAGAARAKGIEPSDRELAQQNSDRPEGYRISVGDSGFELIEHGVWERNEVAAAPAQPLRLNGTGGASVRARDAKHAVYLPHIVAAEARYAIPAGLLDALVFAESRYNPLALSSAGAAGLGQLMPRTARELGIVNRFDPRENLDGAARYLRKMLDRFGIVHLALAAYNAGPRAVERAGGMPQNRETPAYVREVLRRWRF